MANNTPAYFFLNVVPKCLWSEAKLGYNHNGLFHEYRSLFFDIPGRTSTTPNFTVSIRYVAQFRVYRITYHVFSIRITWIENFARRAHQVFWKAGPNFTPENRHTIASERGYANCISRYLKLLWNSLSKMNNENITTCSGVSITGVLFLSATKTHELFTHVDETIVAAGKCGETNPS